MGSYATKLFSGISFFVLMGAVLSASDLGQESDFANQAGKVDPIGFNSTEKQNTDSILTPVEAFDDFGGWMQIFRFDQSALFDVSPVRFSSSFGMLPDSIPNVGNLIPTLPDFNPDPRRRPLLLVPPDTESLTLQTDTVSAGVGSTNPFLTEYAPQLIGFGSFREDTYNTSNSSVFVEEDKLYMVQWNISTPFEPDHSNQLPLAQLIVGETGSYGLGRSLISFDNNGFNNLVGDNLVFRQYFYAHADGEIGFFINLFDQATAGTRAAGEGFPDGHIGHDVTINRIDVFEVNIDGLDGETVVFNQGQSEIPLLGDEPEPTDMNLSGGFELDIWAGRDQFVSISEFYNEDEHRNPSHSPLNPLIPYGEIYSATGETTDTLSMTIGSTGTGALDNIWDTFNSLAVDPTSSDPIISSSREVFEIDEGHLVFMDFWLSATGDTSALPFTRVGMSSANVGPGGEVSFNGIQGYVAYHEFEPSSKIFDRMDASKAEPSLELFEGAARRARLVWEVQLTSQPGATGGGQYAFRPAMESFVIPVVPNGREALALGTINMHRVVVTTYDPIAGIENILVPEDLTDL